ncbi:retrovirus-related Pol polyprotein from type-1 retrotransposable element R2, partial [Caerostris darwini]
AVDSNSSNIEHDVAATLCGLTSRIPQTPPPPMLLFDASSPMMSGTFSREEVAINQAALCQSPNGIIFDGSSPPAMSGSFFRIEDCECPSSHLCPPCENPAEAAGETLPSVLHVPLSADDEVALFPSDLEVRDLFIEKSPSARFDFINLSCVQCRRRFSSVSGLELHMKDLHDVLVFQDKQPVSTAPSTSRTTAVPPSQLLGVGPCSGPPRCAPFPNIRPSKTWASVAAKQAVCSSQPWSGRRIDLSASVETTPRRPVGSRPSRPSVASQSSQQDKNTTLRPSTSSKQHLKISFSTPASNPDGVSHVVLLPKKARRKTRKMLPCPRCDFTFRTASSRDEHLVVHKLEDDFNRLHGIVGDSSDADFGDFVLPKPVVSKSGPKPVKTQPARHRATAISSRQVPPPTSQDLSQRVGTSTDDAPRPTLSCHLCEKTGFPNKKALRYHLFRLHQVPIGRPDSSKAVPSSSSAIPQVLPGRAAAVSSPVGVPSPSHPASSFPLVREGDTLLVDFPLTGAVTCTEADCSRQFIAKTWSSAVWSVKKHLRVFHNLPITSSRLGCRMCGSVICKPIKKHACFVDIEPYAPHFSSQWQCDSCQMSFPSALSLRNHLDGHKRAGLRADAPQLSLPNSTSKKSRRKRAKHRPTVDIGEPSVVHDSNAVLAQPIDQEPLNIDRIVPE